MLSNAFLLCCSSCWGAVKKTVFSAGLDITEMYQPDNHRLANFWESLQNLWLELYGTGMATVAAIDGHAPAGGCMLVSRGQ